MTIKDKNYNQLKDYNNYQNYIINDGLCCKPTCGGWSFIILIFILFPFLFFVAGISFSDYRCKVYWK
jgi:hypothetical protein